MDDINLGLDIDHDGDTPIVRIVVAAAHAYARHTGAAVLTAACRSYGHLLVEVERLERELRSALERAGDALGEEPGERVSEPPEPQLTGVQDKPLISSDLTVRDIMTAEVWTVGPNDRLSLARELMKQGRFRHVVVLEEDEAIAGVISQRDVFHGALAWSLGQGQKAHERILESTRAKDVMNTEIMTIEPEASLQKAAQLMRKEKVGCLPVVDAEMLVGIITEGDFLALLSV